MKVLGIDPSTKSTGYAVYDDITKEIINSGVITTEKGMKLLTRIHTMTQEIIALYKQSGASCVVLENVPQIPNQTSMRKLLWLSGSILANLVGSGLCCDYDLMMPSEWRSKLDIKNGRGIKRAEVKQATLDYVRQLGLNPVSDDEADAIALTLAFVKERREQC